MRERASRYAAAVTALLLLATSALGCTRGEGPDVRAVRTNEAISAASDYLVSQRTDDHWKGEQYFYTKEDPHAYGVTAYHVLLLNHLDREHESRDRAIEYLLDTQGADGDWGATPTRIWPASLRSSRRTPWNMQMPSSGRKSSSRRMISRWLIA